ncbi:MAG: Gfo/Idh/MocA family oxidoreductase [Lacunisphaera sp.]
MNWSHCAIPAPPAWPTTTGCWRASWAIAPCQPYPAGRFAEMIREQKPDTVFVCSVDATHHDYIVRALHAGCDVITEKPMTTDAAKCRAILQAVAATGRSVRVAFNYRWAPFRTKVKELLTAGAIGRVHSVTLEYMLDTNHGADYFRRWHAEAANSGTLLVHKSTHHFDLVNWWLDAIPAQVFAYGDLVFYGRENAERRGDGKLTRYPRYTGHPEAKNDPFRLDLDESEPFRKLYRAGEAGSGYVRDRNVFRDGIDIPDQMSLNVRYRTRRNSHLFPRLLQPARGHARLVQRRPRPDRIPRVHRHAHEPRRAPEGFQTGRHARAGAEGEWIRGLPAFPAQLRGARPGPGRRARRRRRDSQPRVFRPGAHGDRSARTLRRTRTRRRLHPGRIAGVESIKRNQPVNLNDLVPLKPEATKLSELV